MTPTPEVRKTAEGPTGDRADRKRESIVKAARECFLRDGYGAGMDAIAAEAGVSKVTVYNHFGSKEALFRAVVGAALDDALGATFTEARKQLEATDDIRAALTATARVWVDGVAHPSVLALRNLVAGELGRFPELGTAWQERGPGRFIELLTGVLDNLVERGELRVGDTQLAVIQLFALTLYPHLVFSSYGSTIDRDLSERLIKGGVDMFLRYYEA
jgi:TetR/AcrR family transcriptional regulator, mexJK operon transcriptional repressor